MRGFGLNADGHRGPGSPERIAGGSFRVTLDRIAGYLEGPAGHGILPAEVPLWEAPGSVRELGREGARWLFGLRPRPTAVLCMSDELALGALRAAEGLARGVRGEGASVGSDDPRAASWADLTTVRQDLVEKGRQAGELALRLLDGGRPGRPVTIGVD